MEPLVTIGQAKRHLVIVTMTDEDEEDLSDKLQVAQEYVLAKIQETLAWSAEMDAWTSETAPHRVKGAILQAVGILRGDRGDDPAAVTRGWANVDELIRMLVHPVAS